MKRLLALVFTLMTFTSTACAETLRLYSIDSWREAFLAENPGVSIQVNSDQDVYYRESDQFVSAFSNNRFDWDVFGASFYSADLDTLMDQGCMLDLSGSEIIREAVGRMHPVFQRQIMRDGHIYAVPLNLSETSSVLMVNSVMGKTVWEELGYTEADVPQTFPAFLDFIESWLDRRDQDPSLTTPLLGGWDMTLYNQHSYAYRLVQILMNGYIMQLQAAGEPLRFNHPELAALLERTRLLGDRIHTYESKNGGTGRSLFDETSIFNDWDRFDKWNIPVRMTEDQPELAPKILNIAAVNASTEHPELAIQYLEYAITHFDDWQKAYSAFLYQDAQPIPDPSTEREVRLCQNQILMAEHRLAGDSTPYQEYIDLTDSQDRMRTYAEIADSLSTWSDEEVEQFLERTREGLERTQQYFWKISPEQLTLFQQFAPSVHIEQTNAFTRSTEAQKHYILLLDQYTSGLFPVEQWLSELDSMAQAAENP